MPEWLQVLYAIVIVCMIPFCAWVAVQVQKNRVEIARIVVQVQNIEQMRLARQNEIDARCRLERENYQISVSALGRLERNVVRIGTAMNLKLENTDHE